MYLSISSYSWLPSSFQGRIEVLPRHGIEAVEIFCTPRHLDINDADEVQAAGMALRELQIEQVSVHAPSNVGDLSAFDEVHREDCMLSCQRALDAAMLMGAQTITFHPTGIDGEMTEASERWPALRETLQELSGYAEDRDIDIAIENFPKPLFGSNPVELYEKLVELNLDNVGMCLDIGHAFVGGYLPGMLEKMGEKVFSVHVSDNRGTVDEHLPPGQGNIRYESVFEGLQSIGFDGPLVFEVRDGRKFEVILQDMLDFAERTGLLPVGQLSH